MRRKLYRGAVPAGDHVDTETHEATAEPGGGPAARPCFYVYTAAADITAEVFRVSAGGDDRSCQDNVATAIVALQEERFPSEVPLAQSFVRLSNAGGAAAWVEVDVEEAE